MFAILVVGFSLAVTMQPLKMLWLAYQTNEPTVWGIFTHVLYNDIIGALFSALSLWSVGQSTERDNGTAKTIIFATIIAVLSTIAVHLGAAFVGTPGMMSSAWVVVGCLWVAWAVRYPNTPLCFFTLTIPGRWMALFGVIVTILAFTPYQLSPMAVLPLGFAYLFASNKLPFLAYGLPRREVTPPTGPRGIKPPRADYFDDVKRREAERTERERLRKMFESSVKDDES